MECRKAMTPGRPRSAADEACDCRPRRWLRVCLSFACSSWSGCSVRQGGLEESQASSAAGWSRLGGQCRGSGRRHWRWRRSLDAQGCARIGPGVPGAGCGVHAEGV